jgi:hypothetical protein
MLLQRCGPGNVSLTTKTQRHEEHMFFMSLCLCGDLLFCLSLRLSQPLLHRACQMRNDS